MCLINWPIILGTKPPVLTGKAELWNTKSEAAAANECVAIAIIAATRGRVALTAAERAIVARLKAGDGEALARPC